MNIEIDNHKILTGLLTAALISGGGIMYKKLQQIDSMQNAIDDLQKEVKHIKSKTPQIEKNKDSEQDLKIEVDPIVKEFYTNKEAD